MSSEQTNTDKKIQSLMERLYDDAWKDGYTYAYKEMIDILRIHELKEEVQ